MAVIPIILYIEGCKKLIQLTVHDLNGFSLLVPFQIPRLETDVIYIILYLVNTKYI